jgi:hypothetical protein
MILLRLGSKSAFQILEELVHVESSTLQVGPHKMAMAFNVRVMSWALSRIVG